MFNEIVTEPKETLMLLFGLRLKISLSKLMNKKMVLSNLS